jgi:hypothetical protein
MKKLIVTEEKKTIHCRRPEYVTPKYATLNNGEAVF